MAKTEASLDEQDSISSPCSYEYPFDRRCSYPAVNGDKYCILHSRVENKDENKFTLCFKEELEGQRLANQTTMDLQGIVFPIWFNPQDYDLSGIKCIYTHRTVFQRSVYFFNLKFVEKVVFSETVFEDQVDFVDVEFSGGVLFKNATFQGVASFSGLRFSSEASFEGAVFQAEANFTGATFFSPTRFFETKFHEEASFEQARFEGPANFTRATFNDLASFDDTAFAVAPSFESAKLNALFNKTQFPWGTSFMGADLSQVEFRGTNLEGCLFSNCVGLETCRFSHVIWHWRGRRVISDELKLFWPATYEKLVKEEAQTIGSSHRFMAFKFPRWPEEKAPNPTQFRVICQMYHQLKQNYEGGKNFVFAGHFHYGEMEMRRRNSRNQARRTVGSILGWYWVLSGYGERSWRAIIAFSIVFSLSAVLYSSQGMPCSQSLFLSARVSLLRGNVFEFTENDFMSWVMLVETILGPLTLGLFALTVRRQLRRN